MDVSAPATAREILVDDDVSSVEAQVAQLRVRIRWCESALNLYAVNAG